MSCHLLDDDEEELLYQDQANVGRSCEQAGSADLSLSCKGQDYTGVVLIIQNLLFR